MTDYCHTIINELDDRISELTYEQNNSLVSYENAIVLVLQKIEEVKKHIQEKGFKVNVPEKATNDGFRDQIENRINELLEARGREIRERGLDR